jgi:RNA polymerase sigma factor (sigma-70 family)
MSPAGSPWVERAPFAPTQWSMILRARGDSAEAGPALERLCRAYLPPVYAYIRREGHEPAEAQDLTQEFFARLLAGESLLAVTPLKGRFRSWLIGALKNFLLSEWRRRTRLKRGGRQRLLSLEEMSPAVRAACEPRASETPETAYERRWAETLLARVAARLAREYDLAGQSARYAALRVYLPQGGPGPAYVETAAALGLSEAAVKSAIHSLRQRFGQLVRHEVAQTVSDPAEIEDELRALRRALLPE